MSTATCGRAASAGQVVAGGAGISCHRLHRRDLGRRRVGVLYLRQLRESAAATSPVPRRHAILIGFIPKVTATIITEADRVVHREVVQAMMGKLVSSVKSHQRTTRALRDPGRPRAESSQRTTRALLHPARPRAESSQRTTRALFHPSRPRGESGQRTTRALIDPARPRAESSQARRIGPTNKAGAPLSRQAARRIEPANNTGAH